MSDEKTQVNDIDRSLYDFRYEEKEGEFFRLEQGLTKEIVEKLSAEKGDPEWMKEFRLKSLEIYNQLRVPDWGPSIDDLHMEQIATYVRPNTKLDEEAFKRGTSVYFPDHVLPMLPVELSNGICSLNPNEDRFALAVEMKINPMGKVVDYEIHKGIIKSSYRMTKEKRRKGNFALCGARGGFRSLHCASF